MKKLLCFCTNCTNRRKNIFWLKLKIYQNTIEIFWINKVSIPWINFEFFINTSFKALPRIFWVQFKDLSNHFKGTILLSLLSFIRYFVIGTFSIQTLLFNLMGFWIINIFIYTTLTLVAHYSFIRTQEQGDSYFPNSVQKIALSFVVDSLKRYKKTNQIDSNSFIWRLFKVSNYLFSSKTNKEIFEPIMSDWQEEFFEALFKKEIWKARWINVRYTYAFLSAMWQKSPIGDLIEFVTKIAKP